MSRCPLCRARLSGAAICPRCGANLALPQAAQGAAAQHIEQALAYLAAMHTGQALKLYRTPFVEVVAWWLGIVD